jgi:TfoX/Sxy family transcriptional regulator of competence genes
MEWTKPSPQTIALFEALAPSAPPAEARWMFGMPCRFANGHMFCGVYQEDMLVRLPEDARRELEALGGAPFEPMGRTMEEYMVLPESLRDDHDALRAWFARALAFVVAMPPRGAPPRNIAATRGRA